MVAVVVVVGISVVYLVQCIQIVLAPAQGMKISLGEEMRENVKF